MIARRNCGCSKIWWNAVVEIASISDTPSPQFDTKARSAMPDSGTITVTKNHSTTTAHAGQRHLPSGSGRLRVTLPLTVTKRLAERSM